MPRQDVPYGGAICRLRERIAEIFDKLGEKLHTINGVPGDGDGNVKIVSGSSAVVITNDPTQNEISVALDNSQLPAATVSSVNGQTGAVSLDAGDIPTVGGSGDVQADLQDLASDISGNTAAINAEVLARQGADSTLQTNINAVAADVAPYTGNTGSDLKPIKIVNGNPVAVTNDLVDTASAQTVGGAKTFSAQMLATGQRAYAPGNTTDVATISTLDQYSPMVRTSGNQSITGIKTFGTIAPSYIRIEGADTQRRIMINRTDDDVTTAVSAAVAYPFLSWNDKNQVIVSALYASHNTDGTTSIIAVLRNSNGTSKFLTIARGDII